MSARRVEEDLAEETRVQHLLLGAAGLAQRVHGVDRSLEVVRAEHPPTPGELRRPVRDATHNALTHAVQPTERGDRGSIAARVADVDESSPTPPRKHQLLKKYRPHMAEHH